jgi:hypothetical protein
MLILMSMMILLRTVAGVPLGISAKEGLADSWRRHLLRNQASVTALWVRPPLLPLDFFRLIC